jgi:hypothetical protein
MSNRRALSNAVKESKQPKQLSKPKDIDYNSQMGYRDDSPFRNKSSIDINTPTGSIDMSNTGIPLMANGKYLPPYSGTHQFDTNVVRETPFAEGGMVEATVDENGEPKCPDGYEYNPDTGYCEKPGDKCPKGYEKDPETGKCRVMLKTCSSSKSTNKKYKYTDCLPERAIPKFDNLELELEKPGLEDYDFPKGDYYPDKKKYLDWQLNQRYDTQPLVKVREKNIIRKENPLLRFVTGYDKAKKNARLYKEHKEWGDRFKKELGKLDSNPEDIKFPSFRGIPLASWEDLRNRRQYKKDYKDYIKNELPSLIERNKEAKAAYEQELIELDLLRRAEEDKRNAAGLDPDALVEWKKGGGLKSKKYSKSLQATNKFFRENPLFEKPKKLSKKRIYDPNARYYQDGGASSPEEWDQEIKDIEGQIGNPANWTMDDYYLLQDKLNAYKDWRENTPEGQAVNDSHNEEGEYNIPLPEHLQDYTNAMMKARLAYANEFGNLAAKRMINLPDNPYQFENGDTGTHYMSSMDNYAVPQIQDENSQLMLGDYGPDSREAMRFDSDEDANYFAEHYKDVSPGFMELELSPEEIEEYAKGGYIVEDISVPELSGYAEGGEPCPDGYRKNYLGTDCVPMEAPEQTNDEEWYRNWYANRMLQDEEGQQLLETARPKILKRAEKFPEEEWYTKFGSSESGSFEPLTGKITLNRGRLDSNPFLRNEVKFHEKGHYLTSPSMLDPETDTAKEVDAHPIQQLKNYEADVVNQALKERKDIPRKDRKYYDYLKGKGKAKPYTEEISKNVMQARRLAGFKPGQVITDEDINNFYKQADEKGWTNPDSELFVEPLRNLKDFTKGPEELKMLFNKLAENKAQQEDEFQPQTARYGGSLDTYAGGGEYGCADDEKWDEAKQKCVKIVQNLSESTHYDPAGKKIQTNLFQKLKDAKDAYQNFTKQHRGKKYRLNDADSASSIEQLRKGIQLYKDEYAKEQESTRAELKKLENLKSKAALKNNKDIQSLNLKDLNTVKGKMKIDAAIRNSDLDSGTIAALYKGFKLDTVDRNVMKEGYKGQWQDAVNEANARKEANMGITNTALELFGGGAYRVAADPLGTLKGVGQTVGDIATLPFGLATGVYNYATDGNFDMGTNAWGDSYGKGLSQTGDLLSAIPGLGAAGKLAKFTKAADLAGDIGKGVQTFGKAAKNKYINIAEGDNVFDYAWRSPASRFDDAAIKPTQEIGYPQSQAEFNKLRSLDNLTDQEKVMLKDYETYSRHYTGRGMQDWTNNPFLQKKQAFEQTIGNAKVQSDEPFVMTRRINTENPELFNMNKGVYEPKRITSWSAGRDNIGNTEFSGGKDRLVIKNKAGESNVFKNQYEGLTDAQKQQYKELLRKESPDRPDEFIDRHIQDFANTNRSFERELILPADVKLKQLGKIKNKIGGYDYVMKPTDQIKTNPFLSKAKQFFDRPPGPMMLLGPSGGTNMVKKNIPYYEQLLNTYDSKVMSATNKKFYKDLIGTAKKQDGMLTEAQLRELDRLKTGNFDFGKKGYAKGGTTNDYIEMDIPKSKVQWYIDNGYDVEVLE